MIAIWIEEKIRNLQHENSAVTERQSAGEIQSIHKIFLALGLTSLTGTAQDGDPIGPFGPARRGFRNFVVCSTGKAVHFHALQAGRVGILQVLNDPEPATVVEFYRYRLGNLWFRRDQPCSKAARQGHVSDRFTRAVPLGIAIQQRKQEYKPHEQTSQTLRLHAPIMPQQGLRFQQNLALAVARESAGTYNCFVVITAMERGQPVRAV
jgi:hypothetical protein